MSNNNRRMDFNQNPIEDAAINLIKSLRNNLIDCLIISNEAVLGKNKTTRDIAAMESAAAVDNLLTKVKSWADIIEAKENGDDVHSHPLKSKKLDIVSGSESDFGQFIIDKTKDGK